MGEGVAMLLNIRQIEEYQKHREFLIYFSSRGGLRYKEGATTHKRPGGSTTHEDVLSAFCTFLPFADSNRLDNTDPRQPIQTGKGSMFLAFSPAEAR